MRVVQRTSRLVWVALLVTGVADAQSVYPGKDVGTEVSAGPATLEVTPAVGNDVDPGPPVDVVAASWLLRQQPLGSSALPNAPFVPPLQLRLEFQPIVGVTPFVATHLGPRLGGLPSTNVGAGIVTGPLHFGTRFSLSRDNEAWWLHNASFARYVDPVFDLGVETVNAYAIGADAVLVQRALLGSVALHPDPSAPTLRVNTALFPAAGRSFSSVSTFGRF